MVIAWRCFHPLLAPRLGSDSSPLRLPPLRHLRREFDLQVMNLSTRYHHMSLISTTILRFYIVRPRTAGAEPSRLSFHRSPIFVVDDPFRKGLTLPTPGSSLMFVGFTLYRQYRCQRTSPLSTSATSHVLPPSSHLGSYSRSKPGIWRRAPRSFLCRIGLS